jgi:hypothetical protein
MISARRKRHILLAALAVVGYMAGLPMSRLLDSYRGVVLSCTGQQAYVAYLDRMPRLRRLPGATPGGIVAKARGAWRARPVEALGKDIALVQLYERYHGAYDAQVVRVEPPAYLGAAAVAIAETDRGDHLRVLLGAPHLTQVAVGDRLHKDPQTWDPVVPGQEGTSPPPPGAG